MAYANEDEDDEVTVKVEVAVQKSVAVPCTARGWGLRDTKSGSRIAALRLTAAVIQALKAEGDVYERFRTIVAPVLDELDDDYGAWDADVRFEIRQVFLAISDKEVC